MRLKKILYYIVFVVTLIVFGMAIDTMVKVIFFWLANITV